jgi:acetyltransferase-like isoleucine patch superfamily enzyme
MTFGPEIFNKCHCDPRTLNIRSILDGGFVIDTPENLVIGDYCVLNSPMYIHAGGYVRIGKYCHIAQGFTLYSVNHNWRSKDWIPYGKDDTFKPVTIGDAVWVCANVSVGPGVTIGNGAILSMGSVVFADVPECAIVRGNPAQILTYRDKEAFRKCYEEGKFV